MIKSKCADWRADFSPDEGVPLKGTREIADYYTPQAFAFAMKK
jgi:hypothetical protein